MPYYKTESGLSVALGNSKLGEDTLILNMGSAKNCPSKKLGMCKLGNKCYARKAEKNYPAVLPSRERQAKYWLESSAHAIIADFDRLLGKGFDPLPVRKRKKAFRNVRYLRVNESGDFYSQACVDKLNLIAYHLKREYGITVYTYTARKDLDFSDASFLVKGSSNDAGNNGRTMAAKIPHNKDFAGMAWIDTREGIEYTICPMDCRDCTLCKESNNRNIVFPLH